jgi:hypothetical protein
MRPLTPGRCAGRPRERDSATDGAGKRRGGGTRPFGDHRGRAGHRQVRAGTAAVAETRKADCQVFWGAGDELGQALPLLPFLDGLRVREPSTNPQLLALVTERARCGRPSWSSTICSGPTRPASPCGDSWPGRRSRYRCCWSGWCPRGRAGPRRGGSDPGGGRGLGWRRAG